MPCWGAGGPRKGVSPRPQCWPGLSVTVAWMTPWLYYCHNVFTTSVFIKVNMYSKNNEQAGVCVFRGGGCGCLRCLSLSNTSKWPNCSTEVTALSGRRTMISRASVPSPMGIQNNWILYFFFSCIFYFNQMKYRISFYKILPTSKK